ncbi:MAG TPA: hypothetical protein VMP01_00125 [Pirellulaceae bacterium]|nr:hypothetical protein [Pirellulaceae bacterium]
MKNPWTSHELDSDMSPAAISRRLATLEELYQAWRDMCRIGLARQPAPEGRFALPPGATRLTIGPALRDRKAP